LKRDLKVPLIGFCGGPYTVSTYLNAPLQDITDVTIDYLKMQEKAGVDAIQIFDSWANALSPEEFQTQCLPYLKQLVDAVNVPVILFMRDAKSRLNELLSLNPDCISFDSEIPNIPIAVQGNLNPDLLFEPLPIIRQKVRNLMSSMQDNRGFILNLGHGVKPNTPVEAVRCLVDTVKTSQRENNNE
jgi:uroporphyrinogen decarboxylase